MAFIIRAIVIDRDKASPSFRRDRDRGACKTRTSSSSSGTMTAGPYGTSSSGGTTIGGPVVGLEHPLPLAGP
jgi:hypothetical protein